MGALQTDPDLMSAALAPRRVQENYHEAPSQARADHPLDQTGRADAQQGARPSSIAALPWRFRRLPSTADNSSKGECRRSRLEALSPGGQAALAGWLLRSSRKSSRSRADSRAPRIISKSLRFCRHEEAAKGAAEKENAISTIDKIT